MQSIYHVMESVSSAKQAPLLLVDELATSTSSTDGVHCIPGIVPVRIVVGFCLELSCQVYKKNSHNCLLSHNITGHDVVCEKDI